MQYSTVINNSHILEVLNLNVVEEAENKMVVLYHPQAVCAY
jgi:hypothetical protein